MAAFRGGAIEVTELLRLETDPSRLAPSKLEDRDL